MPQPVHPHLPEPVLQTVHNETGLPHFLYDKMGPGKTFHDVLVAQHLDVLHSPDLSAGGSASGTSGLGDRSVNRSIGANWGQNGMERVRAMDEVAKQVPAGERAHTKMDVELKRCP